MKKEDENQERKGKERLFFFFLVLRGFDFFFWFSELDTGISRISRLVPDEEGR